MRRCMGCMSEFGEQYDVCPNCGYIVGTPAKAKNYLEPGTLLHNRYVIGKALGQGGFGITYIAWDQKIERAVAVKEYMPNAFASRITGQKAVSCYSEEAKEQFRNGLEKTKKETKTLGRFNDMESVVKVFDCIEENDTAYIIMELLRGRTVKEILANQKTLSYAETVRIMVPVLEALQVMHEAGMIHRDVAPDNIFVCTDGRIKLLDFGAARVMNAADKKSLSVMVKHGYAPIEQYSSTGKQGSYTDVYASAATIYKMLTGETLPDSVARSAQDDVMIKLNPNADVPQSAKEAICKSLQSRPDQRIQTVRELSDALQKDLQVDIKGIDPKQFLKFKTHQKIRRLIPAIVAAFVGVAVIVGGVAWGVSHKRTEPPVETDMTLEVQSEEMQSTRNVEVQQQITELAVEETTEPEKPTTQEELREALKKATPLDIFFFDCLDYNRDGQLEAFAVATKNGTQAEYNGYNADLVEIWFVSPKTCVKVDTLDEQPWFTKGEIVDLTNTQKGWALGQIGAHVGYENYAVDTQGMYKRLTWTTDGTPTVDYGCTEDTLLLNFGMGYESMPQYFRYDASRCGFVEYGGIEITQAQLKKLAGTEKAFKQIKDEKGTIQDILYRKNGVININYAIAGEGRRFITLNVEQDGSVSFGNARGWSSTDELYTNGGYYVPSVVEDMKESGDEEELREVAPGILGVDYPGSFPY